MTSRRFNLLTLASVLVALPLLPGYFGMLSISMFHRSPAGNDVWTVAIDGGSICGDLTRFNPQTPPQAPVWFHAGLRNPDLSRWLLGFRCHSIPGPNYIAYYFGFPLWCIGLPCAIAPTVWLIRRLRPDSARGFAVVTNADPELSQS